MLKNLNIGIAMTGSFCTIEETLKEIEKISEQQANITPIISETVKNSDTRFGNSGDLIEKLENISGNKVISSIIEAEKIGPKALFDILIIAPCTGNTISKLSNSIIDTTVTMAAKAHLRNQRPVVISIATNDGLGNSAKNIGEILNMKNIYLVPFGQDNYKTKPNSLVAKTELIIPTVVEALSGKQLQPILV